MSVLEPLLLASWQFFVVVQLDEFRMAVVFPSSCPCRVVIGPNMRFDRWRMTRALNCPATFRWIESNQIYEFADEFDPPKIVQLAEKKEKQTPI